MSEQPTFVKWSIFSGNNKWKISVYKGTPLNDIKQNIADVTGIEKFVCMDESGDIIALSSYIPDGIKLFIQSTTVQKQKNSDNNNNDNNNNDNNNNDNNDDMKISDLVELHFDPTTLVTTDNNNHKLSNNKLEFSEISNKGWGGIMTDIDMKDSNIYIWSTKFSKFCCCYDKWFIISHKKLIKKKKEKDFKFQYATYSDCDICSGCIECYVHHSEPFKNWPNDAEYELIHVIDMKKKLYWIFAANYCDPIILIKELPECGVYFGSGIKHQIKCTIKSLKQLDKKYKLETGKQTKVEIASNSK